MRGVYTFLEDYCGIRWYMMTELGEVVPEATSITVPDRLDVRRKPDFVTRMAGRYPWTAGGWWGEHGVWMHRVGGGTTRDATWANHTFQGIAKKLRDEGGHPEFFADVGEGKRSNEYLCFTAPGLADYIAEYVIEEFEKRNLIDGASGPVMPWDGYRANRMCKCERCRPYVEMGKKQAEVTAQRREAGLGTYWFMNECGDYVWRLFVKVANILKGKAPQIRVTNCAYGSYCLPPQGVTFPDNVGIQIALDWPATESEQQRTLHRIDEWAKRVDHLVTWEYGCHHIWFNPEAVIWPHGMVQHIREYKKRGLEGVSMETEIGSYPQTGQYQAMDHINHYVQIKFLLDADQDLDQMLNEYYDKFYGPAAATMKRFYERQMRQWDRGLAYRDPRVNNYEYVGELMSMLNHARRKAEDDSVYAQRLDAVIYDYMPWYTRQKQMAEPEALEIRTVSEAPVIDGDLSDAVWGDKPKVDFYRVGQSWGYFTQPKYAGRGGHEDPNHGWGICVRYGESLYLALKTGTAKPDSLMKDSYSEVVFASPEGKRYVLRVKPNGGVSGKTYAPGDSSGKSWRPAVECAATVDDHLKWRADWFAEFSLPLESFGEPLTDEWRVNWGGWTQGRIPRMRSGPKAYAYAWHATGSGYGSARFQYDPAYYGRVKLTP